MFNKFACRVIVFSLLFCTAAAPFAAAAQNIGAPQREQLLNGLPIIFLPQPGDPSVLLKLRINSGAAFDLAGKEGMMQILSAALFPDPTTRQYVAEELGGRLDVTTTYDTIDITLAGKATEFERLVGLLRNAVVNLRLAEAEIARLREEQIKRAEDLSQQPAQIADRAAVSRLYGAHPYGRLLTGTPETLARFERADLLLARDRFIHPNNSTLVLIGGVERSRAMRAFRQFLGAWRKSDAIVPASFRQPEAPGARTLLVNQPGAETVEVRLALRGLSRADRDLAAARLLPSIAQHRWQAALNAAPPLTVNVRHDAHTLSGLFLLSATVPGNAAAKAVEAAQGILPALAAAPVTTAELEKARGAALAHINARKSQNFTEFLADQWLDAASYGLPANYDEAQAINSVTPADVQRVATRLFQNAPMASVVVGDAAQLRDSLAKLANGFETPDAKPAAPPAPTSSALPIKRP